MFGPGSCSLYPSTKLSCLPIELPTTTSYAKKTTSAPKEEKKQVYCLQIVIVTLH